MEFKCKRCGFCCSNIRGRMLGAVSGLTLLPDEISLFPTALVKPFIRYRLDAPTKAGQIFVYQLDVKDCPLLRMEDMSCKIYGRHPRICKAYPFELMERGLVAHGACPEIMRLGKEGMTVSVPESFRTSALEIHVWYLQHIRESNFKIERFDLETMRWRALTEDLNEEETKWLKKKND